MTDWMARPSGRFLMWWVLVLIGMSLMFAIAGVAWGVMDGIESLTGSKTVAFVVALPILISFVAAFNAWIWTATGNRYVQALMRVMQRMEGRKP